MPFGEDQSVIVRMIRIVDVEAKGASEHQSRQQIHHQQRRSGVSRSRLCRCREM